MKKFLKGFTYAASGIATAFRERNFRFHICMMLYMFYFLFCHDFFAVSKTETAVLLLTCSVVLSLECMNTAVERAVDLATKERHPLAKQAKDAAAGAVLIAAIIAVIIGLVILLQPAAFVKMFTYYKSHLLRLLLLILSLVISYLCVFIPKKEKSKND